MLSMLYITQATRLNLEVEGKEGGEQIHSDRALVSGQEMPLNMM